MESTVNIPSYALFTNVGGGSAGTGYVLFIFGIWLKAQTMTLMMVLVSRSWEKNREA
ncbi:MAG TPA: hypothetical protein VFZ52_16410 [Chryseolinea sp.]